MWGWLRDDPAHGVVRVARLLAAGVVAISAAGCSTDNRQNMSLAAPQGASVAFDSIDGPPRGVFDKLVLNLNAEAQARQIAVVSREQQSAYRVRGYLAAAVTGGRPSISWVWDVYDSNSRRAMRFTGEEHLTGAGKVRDVWASTDDEAIQRIARASMDQLRSFLALPPSAAEPAIEPSASGGEPVAGAEPGPSAASLALASR